MIALNTITTYRFHIRYVYIAVVRSHAVETVKMVLAIRTKRVWTDVCSTTGDLTVTISAVIAAHKEKTNRHSHVIGMGYVYLAATRRFGVQIVFIVVLATVWREIVREHLVSVFRVVRKDTGAFIAILSVT